MIVGTGAVLWTLTQLTPNKAASAAVADRNAEWFPFFLAFFLFVFAATGIGNGSTYKMIPAICDRGTGTRARAVARSAAPRRPPRPSA